MNFVTTHSLRVDDGVTNKMLDTTMRSFWELKSLGIQVDSMENDVSDHFASSVKMKARCRYHGMSAMIHSQPTTISVEEDLYRTPTSVEAEPRDSEGIQFDHSKPT